MALPWVDKVKAVLEMWWPGDEGGWSTANLLLGKVSPAGRLPVTWGKSLDRLPRHRSQAPRALPVKGVDKKTTYSEGVNVGYRWFDKENIEPLFAFGHGLSYTTFDYSGLTVTKSSDGGLDVKVNIKNTGSMASDEVPQVYLGAPGKVPDGVQFPVRALVSLRSRPPHRRRIEIRHPPRSPAPTPVLVHQRSEVDHRNRQAHRQRRRFLPRPPPQPNHRLAHLSLNTTMPEPKSSGIRFVSVIP